MYVGVKELLVPPVERAVESGMLAAALVDREGRVLALAGALSEEEAMPLAALVMFRLKSDDLAERLFAGEVLQLALDGATSCSASRSASCSSSASCARSRPRSDQPVWMRGDRGGGGHGGPTELHLVELGITVPRAKA